MSDAAGSDRSGAASFPGFAVTHAARVALITISRPEARNALTAAMRRDFGLLLAQLDAADDVRAIVLTGADPSFTGGVDLKERLAGDRIPPPVRPNPGEVLRACATPVIAAVNGPCVTGGLEIALSCTFIVASERATFRDTHARLGMLPGWGLSALLPRAIGIRLAREMTLTGRSVDAREALAIGLVNSVCPHEELLPRSLALAQAVTEADPAAVRATLALYERGDGLSLADALAAEQEASDNWRADPARMRESFERLTGR